MTNDDVYSNTKNDVAFAVSKSYLHSKFPEYDDFFEDIWNIAIANLKTNRKIMPTSKEAGALHFVIDNALVEIVNLIIPFISGVVSSVIAGFLLQKHCENPKVTADIIQKVLRVLLSSLIFLQRPLKI
jgi:hypothetical protein